MAPTRPAFGDRRSRQVGAWRGVIGIGLNSWLYSGGHPNRVARTLNRVWAAVWASGAWSQRMNTLEVRGRHSGKRISLPVVVADYEGERYLVAMLDEGAAWVANVRAAGGSAVLRHGRREQVWLEELAPGDRAAILQRYLEVAPAARAHFTVDRQAPVSAFAAIADEHPVFRVRPRAERPVGATSPEEPTIGEANYRDQPS